VFKVKNLWRFPMVSVGLCGVLIIAYFLSRPIDSDPEMHQSMKTSAVVELVGKNMDLWVKEHGRMPTAEEGLRILELKQNPVVDGWGRDLVYRTSRGSNGSSFLLYSVGPNGEDEGAAGDDIAYRGSRAD
jgi:hypothetical protein